MASIYSARARRILTYSTRHTQAARRVFYMQRSPITGHKTTFKPFTVQRYHVLFKKPREDMVFRNSTQD